MNTASIQGNDGIFYEIDLNGIERVAELQEAVLQLQQAVAALQASASMAESGAVSLESGSLEAALEDSRAKVAALKESYAAQAVAHETMQLAQLSLEAGEGGDTPPIEEEDAHPPEEDAGADIPAEEAEPTAEETSVDY